MGKRSLRGTAIRLAEAEFGGAIRDECALFSSEGRDREQGYVRRVRPQSDG
jgi:hypothetical protein